MPGFAQASLPRLNNSLRLRQGGLEKLRKSNPEGSGSTFRDY